jgi:hypothetical protein
MTFFHSCFLKNGKKNYFFNFQNYVDFMALKLFSYVIIFEAKFVKHTCVLKNLQFLSSKKPQVLSKNLPVKKPVRTMVSLQFF